MSKLLLARHAETVWHAENRYAGSSDIALSDTGRTQAEALAGWATQRPISAVYSSDASRSKLTAGPTATRLGMELQIDSRLREVGFGEGEGMTAAEMSETFPLEFAKFRLNPATSPLPGAELAIAALDRAWPALEQIAARHPEIPPLIVMHSTLMRLILCRVVGINPDHYRSTFPTVLNVALTTVSIGCGPMALHSYNVPTV